ncbi:MAG: polyprenyl diphosphate synthase [Candidatus Limnocylindria bacterium]
MSGQGGSAPSDPRSVPRHLAIVMDGNRRWARQRHLPAIAGHRAGVETIRRTLRAARERGVEYLTLYSFSTENWSRDEEEVGALMALLEETIRRETKTLVEDGVRLVVIGRLHELSERLQKAIAGAVNETSSGTRGVMTLAFNYGGRAEIVDAVKRLVGDGVRPDAVDEAAIAKRLYAPGQPDPDLLVRTGGELRVSNFLLWQVAYAEMWATEVLWPDFSVTDLDAALESYAKRERRFGR